jgi:ADP-heptose:LPS heptosyltransferase
MATLVYHAGALGDFITALPAMAVWRRLHPREHSILLGRRELAPLADPVFDELWNVDDAGWAGLFTASAGAGRRPGALPDSVSSALLFAASTSLLAGNLAAWGVAEILRQDPFPASPQPIIDYHLSLFAASARRADDALPRIRVNAEELGAADSGVAALHPGSGSSSKNWPMERFTKLARRLTRSGLRVVWIRGPAESGAMLPEGARAWESVPLDRLAARLARSAIYVGNDSGVSHLAAASGCPTVALFGASDARVWAPRGRAVRVIQSPGKGMRGISVNECCEACRWFVTLD